jgi:hypothetical protein
MHDPLKAGKTDEPRHDHLARCLRSGHIARGEGGGGRGN